jgi:pectate lyase
MRRAVIALSVVAVVAALGLSTMASAATLFSDDFTDGNAAGWSTSGGSWSVVSAAYQQSGTSADAKAQAGTATWTDYSVQARVRPNAFGSNASRAVGIAARAQSTSNFYSLVLTGSNSVQLRRGSTTLASAALTVSAGTWYTLLLTASGSSLTGSVNGAALVSASDNTFGTGRIGLVSSYSAATFDDIAVFTGAAPAPSSPGPASPSPVPSTSPLPPPPPGQADGFATGTTGGAGGATVTATNATQLADYAGRAEPLIIQVSGRITGSSMITVVANKTIVGVGSTAEISGGGLQTGSTTRPGNNVIIRNIVFRDAEDDSVSVTNGAHHVWIDHNEFYPAFDGSVDVKRQSTNVTVSWNVFHGTDKSMLLGHSDGFTDDIGFLKVTYHHNLFDGSNQRHPRVRFGEPVHVYNNYYRNVGLYGVASTMNAGVVVEGNYFENVAFPCYSTSGYADSDPGRLVQRLNVFVNSGTCEAGGTVASPSSYYSYSLDAAAAVPSIVTSGAGVGHL